MSLSKETLTKIKAVLSEYLEQQISVSEMLIAGMAGRDPKFIAAIETEHKEMVSNTKDLIAQIEKEIAQ